MNHAALARGDFEIDPGSGAVQLSSHGMRVFVQRFSGKLESCINSRQVGRSISYRKLIEVRARKLAALMRGDKTAYEPFKMR